jgi:exodeoxyribonuclease VII large subunit
MSSNSGKHMNERTFFNLSAITNRIQEILQPYIGKLFWVKAEISSGRERGGSFYCDLFETSESGEIIAQMRCTIWSRDLVNIRKKFRDYDLDLILDDGTVVGLQCSIQYSPRYGLSLKVFDADPTFALGELELKKKEILDRLKKEGLLEPNKKLFVPTLPVRIGLITSKNSAAANDFIKTLRQSAFGFRVYLADSVVQGNQTEQSIINAMGILEKLKLELVVIIRGGGSKTELFSLDNEAIARKIVAYKYPIWTGIGHEIDVSILDHVANRFFKTPTAVAEELVARFVEMMRHLDEATHRFNSSWTYRIDIERKFLHNSKNGLVQGARKLIESKNVNLKQRANLLSSKVFDRLAKEKSMLAVWTKTIKTAPAVMIRNSNERLKTWTHSYTVSCNRRVNEIKHYLKQAQTRLRSTWSYRIMIEQKYAVDARKGMLQGTRKLVDATKANLRSLAGLMSSRVFDRLSIEKARLTVSENSIKSGALNEIKTQKRDLLGTKTRFQFDRFQQIIERERSQLQNKLAAVKASDPETSLSRGFSLVYKADNQLVKSIKAVTKGESLKTKVQDGLITSTVKHTEEN